MPAIYIYIHQDLKGRTSPLDIRAPLFCLYWYHASTEPQLPFVSVCSMLQTLPTARGQCAPPAATSFFSLLRTSKSSSASSSKRSSSSDSSTAAASQPAGIYLCMYLCMRCMISMSALRSLAQPSSQPNQDGASVHASVLCLPPLPLL